MRWIVLAAPLALAACAGPDTVPMAPDRARDVAATEFAGVDVEGIAKCVRSNATDAELVMLDEGGEIGQLATRAILQRPETGDCIVERSADANLERVG